MNDVLVPDTHVKQFHLVLRWLFPLVGGFAIAFALLGWYFADVATWGNGIAIGMVALIIGAVYVAGTIAGVHRWTAMWVGGAFLVVVPILTLFQPFLVINNASVPLMVGLLLLQYGPQQSTRLSMLLCAVTAVITVLCGVLLPLVWSLPTQLPLVLVYGLQLSSFSATTGIIFLLAGQFWHQRSDALDRLQTSNQQLDAANDSLRDLALRDPLTGLFNRRYVDETLDLEIYRAQRSGLPIGVLLIDLDYFKQVNDTYGHDAGDTLLQVVADALQDQVRSGDIVARYGGEEFLMVLPGIPYPPLAERADRIRVAIQRLQVVHAGQDLGQRSCSIGVALYPDHGPESTTIIKAADDALYAAKAAGRNQVVVATAPAETSHMAPDVLTP